jgi:hypothetical protein
MNKNICIKLKVFIGYIYFRVALRFNGWLILTDLLAFGKLIPARTFLRHALTFSDEKSTETTSEFSTFPEEVILNLRFKCPFNFSGVEVESSSCW